MDGTLATDPADIAQRWQEHFAEVFCGEVVAKTALVAIAPSIIGATALDVGPTATARAFRSLGRNKGVGLDAIPAELLQAGGDPLACKYADVNKKVLATASWPTSWRGGRLEPVFKKKGAS